MTPVIELQGVTKTYQAGDVEVQAVIGVSLEIRRDEYGRAGAVAGGWDPRRAVGLRAFSCRARAKTEDRKADDYKFGEALLPKHWCGNNRHRDVGQQHGPNSDRG